MAIKSEKNLKGRVASVSFHNSETGYTVFYDRSNKKTVVCTTLGINVGDQYIATGDWQTHDKYGEQFNAQVIEFVADNSTEQIETYLSSGIVKGIGAKTAQKIVNKLGENTLETILNHPERLARISGVGQHKAQLIVEAFQDRDIEAKVLRFLISHKISPVLSKKLIDLYGSQTINILTKDPYLLAYEVKGIGFHKADAIAKGFAIAHDSPERIRAGIMYCTQKEMEDRGHCYVEGSDLVNMTRALLGFNLENNVLITDEINYLLKEKQLVRIDERIASDNCYKTETFIYRFVQDRTSSISASAESPEILDAIKAAESELKVSFSEEQLSAVRASSSSRLLIITGGPGSGKTTVVNAITKVMLALGRKTRLAAPTGKAANRLSTVTGIEATTIHRLLKSRGVHFEHNFNNPIDADVLIVDESSMIDIFLAKSLFQSLPEKCSLILVGDKDQLPSVGPGKLFCDLINSKIIPVYQLGKIYRQQEGSSISEFARNINEGILTHIPHPDGITQQDAYMLEIEDPESILALIVKIVSSSIPNRRHIPVDEINVLSPANRGLLGVDSLNQALQEAINPPALGRNELKIGDGILRVGDRVIQRVNNYNLDEVGVFNGETGVVDKIDLEKKIVTVSLWDGRLIEYKGANIKQLSLSYAMTVHRSQGTEIACVVLVVSKAHTMMLERALVYTGMTRAKKLLVLVGSKQALNDATGRKAALNRRTNLSFMLMNV